MSKIYENIFIGNFIFACGKYSGFREQNSSVNLYQQTPYDKSIGDLMLSNNSRTIIIEFKRDEVDLITELNKPHRKSFLTNLEDIVKHSDSNYLENISYKAHFLAFPDNSFQLKFCSYFRYYSNRRESVFYNLESFIKEFYDSEEKERLHLFDFFNKPPEIGVTTNEFYDYLKFMNSDSNNDTAGSIGGLMLTISKNKEMLLVPFEGINQLFLLLQLPIPESISIKTLEEIKEKVIEKRIELEEPPEQISIRH